MAFIDRRELKRLNQLASSGDDQISAYQLARINELWESATEQIPHYAQLVAEGSVPRRFRTLQEYVTTVPPLTKSCLQDDYARFRHPSPPPNVHRVTGGSTGSPVQIPAWRTEYAHNYIDAWVGRGWYGVNPGDKMFLYWGHSHLLGRGVKRYQNLVTRCVKDMLQRYVRQSCYDLSPAAMDQSLRRLESSRAKFVVTYASCLDRLARYARDSDRRLDQLGLKVVVGAAEAFPLPDSESVIQEVFGAPAAMEYGSVETNLIAHTKPSSGYRVFWWNNLVEYAGSDQQEVYITSLYPRCTPLFRYRLGDRIELGTSPRVAADVSLVEFSRVIGRSNAPVKLPSGAELHSEVVSHLVRDMPCVRGYQFVCGSRGVSLRLLMRNNLSDVDQLKLVERSGRISQELARVLTVSVVPELTRSVAGKTPMVLYDEG